MNDSISHFKGKNPLSHVIEAQKEGFFAQSEIHGTEPSGFFSSFADALRETAIFIGLVWQFGMVLGSTYPPLVLFFPLSLGWLIWRGGRGVLLGVSRLERLHRMVEEEKFEIENHRQQEREELSELYRAKGFQGKLLEDVIDVLMADGERLLRVMVQEEMGLALQSIEHPIKQGVGAALGGFIAFGVFILGGMVTPLAPWLTLPVLIGASGALSTKRLHNKMIRGLVFHLALGFVSLGVPHLIWFFQ